MANVFYVDVSAIPTYEERYEIVKKFENTFDVVLELEAHDPFHRTFRSFTATWIYKSSPTLPQLPDTVKITEL